MSRMLAFTFSASDDAARARTALKDLEQRKLLTLDDALVMVRDAEGFLHQTRAFPTPMLIGGIVGALMGLLLVFIFPIISIIFGGVAGAVIGKMLSDRRVDKEAIADVEQVLQPGNSALLVLIRSGEVSVITSALRDFRPHVFQTTLAPDMDARLREALQ